MTSNSELPIKNHFFLCHYHADKERVEEFKKKLEENWISCWIDKVEIKEEPESGTDLYKQISQGIKESYCFIAFITDNFIESGITYKNIETAIAQESSSYPKEILLIGDDKHEDEGEKIFGSIKNKKKVFKDFKLPSLIDDLIEIAWAHDCTALKHASHYLIIENDETNTFAKNFRKSLRKSLKGEYKKTGLVYDYFAAQKGLSLGNPPEPKIVLDEMKIALDDFLDSRARYAYIIMPKELSTWCETFVDRIRDVNKEKYYENKKLFSFECGKDFQKEYKAINDDKKNKRIPLKLIRIITNYKRTTQQLFKELKKKIKHPSHIVIIPGPYESESADERLIEFLSAIQQEYAYRVREDDGKSSKDKKYNPLLSLTILNIGTWKMEVAEDYARASLNNVETYDKEVHTAFICSNDATAIGVLHALSKEWSYRKKNEIHPCLPANISIYGFDRTKEFLDILKGKVDGLFKKNKNKILGDFLTAMKDTKRKLEGATIRTDFDEFTKMACKFINHMDWDNESDFDARRIDWKEDDLFTNIPVDD